MLSHNKHRTRHIDDGNTLGDTNNQGNTCARGFHNSISSTGGWNEDATRVRVSSGFCLRDSIENRYTFDGSTSLGTATLSGGVATLTTSALTLGNHAVTAAFCQGVGTAGTPPGQGGTPPGQQNKATAASVAAAYGNGASRG